jgi:site-specific recombinase XerD
MNISRTKKQINQFLEAMKDRNYSKGTLTGYKTLFNYFGDGEFTAETITSFQEKILLLSSVTRCLYLSKLKQFLQVNYPHLLRYIVKPKMERKVIQNFPKTVDEVKRILEKPDVSTAKGIIDRTMMELFYYTGIRRSELLNLKVEDIDISKLLIRVQQGKFGKDRILPISKRAMGWIVKYLNWVRPTLRINSNYFFLNSEGKKLSPNTPINRLKKYSKYSPHKYRHAYATHLLKKGMKEVSLQRLLGHSELSTTQLYAKVTIQDLQVHYKKYHGRDSWKV